MFSFEGHSSRNAVGGADITDREIVESYIPIAKFIAAMFGPRCEVVVHYLADADQSIIAIENGYLTGRKVGDTLIDLDLHQVFTPEHMSQPFIANYVGKSTVGNRTFRLSTFYIKNSKGDIIGLLNTNVDISDLLTMQNIVAKELFVNKNAELPDGMLQPQALVVSTHSMIESTLTEAMNRYGFTDASTLEREDKLQIISYLCDHNTFVLKGAVGIVAKKLGISEPTTYRYLQKLKAEKAKNEKK